MGIGQIEIGERDRALCLIRRRRIRGRRLFAIVAFCGPAVTTGVSLVPVTVTNILRGNAAMMVVDRNCIGQVHRLASGEVVEIMVRRRKRPGLRTGRPAGGIGQRPQRQPAQLGVAIGKAREHAGCGDRGDRHIVRVGQIDIGKTDRAVGDIQCRQNHGCRRVPLGCRSAGRW